MTATLPSPTDPAVQLPLDLWSRPSQSRRRSGTRPYWEHVDVVDHGGTLHARRPGVRALLAAEKRPDGSWVGYHDLLLIGDAGTSGPTRPQSCRSDALVCAAHGLARRCQHVLAHATAEPRPTVQAARQVARWLDQLGVL